MADDAATNAVCSTCPFHPDRMTYKLYKGQRYVLICDEPYTRLNGEHTTLSRWQSHCADCGDEFTFTRPKDLEPFKPVRRCARHRKPGRRV